MRAVVQRVHQASVEVENTEISRIGTGLLAYVGVENDDSPSDARMLAEKIRYLRCFADDNKPMNRDVTEIQGTVLAVSAFTVQADARRGRRPAFDRAASTRSAAPLFDLFCQALTDAGAEVRRGEFGAHMNIQSNNDGPVCILIDSKKVF